MEDKKIYELSDDVKQSIEIISAKMANLQQQANGILYGYRKGAGIPEDYVFNGKAFVPKTEKQ